MNEILQEARFDFISAENKAFMVAFDEAMARLGYDCGNKIGDGYCWGRYMLIYTKTAAKSKTVAARIYIREDGLVLRLFLNKVDKHRLYIETAPAHIKEVFAGPYGDCRHCRDDQEEVCRFRKSYTLDGRLIDKCNGLTFEFHHPSVEKLPDYLGLFREFFPARG